MVELNIKNRSIFCNDNLNILPHINSESVDLIYLDPPFNKKKVFTAPIGSASEGASFSDIFREKDVKKEWLETIREDHAELNTFLESVKNIEGGASYNFCYLAYMAIRLIELRRILKDTGSLYLHCDPTMSHYLKILLDIIFGEKNFRNEIVWERSYQHNLATRSFDKVNDVIFFYTKNEDYYYSNRYQSINIKELKEKFPYIEEETGRRFNHRAVEESANEYSKHEIRIIQGKEVSTSLGWRWTQETFDKRLEENPNLIYWTKQGRPRYKNYADEYEGRLITSNWSDVKGLTSNSKEATGYPTQKPLALLERIIKASCPEEGIVLDPFCGCATTCVASEKLGQQWVGIDVSHKAYDLVKQRLDKEITGDLFDWNKDITYSVSPPKRTDLGKDSEEKKWVYIITNPKYPKDYKVGIAKDWKSRLNSYQTSDPKRAYKMEYKILTPHFREMEKYIHETFENNHEWVRAELTDIIKEMENYKR